jgi:hypothetical protein
MEFESSIAYLYISYLLACEAYRTLSIFSPKLQKRRLFYLKQLIYSNRNMTTIEITLVIINFIAQIGLLVICLIHAYATTTSA